MAKTQTVHIGAFTVSAFVERRFRLDGGTMFGIIPKVMWQKLVAADEENRVEMQANVFLVTAPNGEKILLDAGLGDALSDFDRKMYAVTDSSEMAAGLATLGTHAEDIDYVILSHLHTDHANGIFTGDPDHPDLLFPNAVHVIQEDEWHEAYHTNERTAAVYYPDRLAAIKRAGKLRLVSGTVEILPGMTVDRTGGHTLGHQGVRIESDGRTFVYYADIFPSRFHVKTPFVASVDTHPMETLAIKKRLLQYCLEHEAVIGFDHDVEFMMGRLVEGKKWLEVAPI